ncbi:hypothetical protein ODZ84_01420 [Chryseobacterium fluminis]|uniref:hypothetical protein n=1 Tax=Chryseobacterium fluminis TaxID=2983606 RepID=UPI0022589667|nr:hypothetical protein [Chryseobacterium sp. MMS21-Ot14]UZT98257.1 hypothetical protein ODZ84_01420 [Chryseobacterium sp. MMS21-Ot14]
MKIDENGNIGIGTTLPKAKVDVVGNGAILGVRNAENLGSWDNLWLKADGASPSINVSGAEKGLQFNVGNNAKGTYGDADQDLTTVATMLPNGNIGIGTDAPTHKLHVEGNIKIIDGTQGNNKVLTSDANGAATWKDLPADKNTNLYTDNGTLTANRTIAQTDKTLAFTGTATNAFSIDGNTLSVDAANDRIGVGTAAPTHKLHVAGSVKIADGTQGNNRVLTSDANGAASWKDLPTDKNTNLYTDNGTLTANRTIAQTDKTLAFTGTATNAFSVDGNTFSVDAKNDRIGLGIATPMGKLDMVADNKTVSTDKEVFLRGYGTSKSPKIYFSSANGTAAVPTNLAYNDDIGGLDFTPHAGNIFPWGNGSAISAKYKGNGTTRLTDLSLKTSGTERLKIDENGNIGVGTATPATKLDIMTGTKQYGLQHSDGTINLRTYLGKGVSNGQTDAAWIGTQSNHPLDLMTNDVVKVRIAANGNMGIGTSAPTHKLEVAGSVKIADGTQGNNKVLTSDANGAATWQDLPTDKNTNLYTDNGTLTANRTIAQADKTLAFTGTATNAFSVDGNTFSVDAKNDRIGLGIATPMGKLDMVADNKTVSTDKEVFLRGYGTSKSPILYISSANGTAAAPTNLVNNEDIGSISFTPRANNNFAWGTGTGISAKYKGNGTTNLTDLSLKTSGTDRMKIDENGNVGIGTSTPDSKLHVAGKVKIADGTQGAGKVLTSDANGVATWQATSTSGKWVLDEIYEEVRTRPLTGYPSRNGVTDLDLTQRVYVTIPAYSKAKVNLYYNVPVTFQNSSNLAHYGYVGAKVKKENVDIPKSARRVIIPSIYSNSNPVVLFTSNSFVDEVTNNTATPMYIRYRAYGVVDITTVGSGGGIPVFYFGNQNNAGESIIKAEVYTKPL